VTGAGAEGLGLASVSLDLDGLVHYARIHGRAAEAVPDDVAALVLERAVPRFLELLAGVGARGTLFVIGAEVTASGRAVLRRALGEGHELGSHSHRHDYALSRQPALAIDQDLAAAEEVLAGLGAPAPRGFRAPGYTLSPVLLQALIARGYAYDASIFPAAPYWAAKAAVLGWMRLLRHRSAAILDTPRVLLAPRLPYRPDPGHPERRGEAPLVELPTSVTPRARLPFIGTFVVRAPWPLVRSAYLSLRGGPFLSFQLHAVDLLGPEDGLPASLRATQGDLQLPLAHKVDRLRQVMGWLGRDFRCAPLLEVAREVASSRWFPAAARTE
jgi:peptidoglycan/xylan/chitin deacetylase (PgdA/CDA1 family)